VLNAVSSFSAKRAAMAFKSAVVGAVCGFAAALSAGEDESSPLAARILRATSPNESCAASLMPDIAITAANNMLG
jgi:hypothetical protein